MPMNRKARGRLAEERICFVCRKEIPNSEGVFISHLMILTHGDCAKVAEKHERDYSTSKRGRWRPIGEILKRIEAETAGKTGPACRACKSSLLDGDRREPSGSLRRPVMSGVAGFEDYELCSICCIKALRALGIWTSRCMECQDPDCEDNKLEPGKKKGK